MRTRHLLVAGVAVALVAAGGTGIALAATSTPAAVPAAVPASSPAQAVDTPESGDTPDAPPAQSADAPEPGDTPDAPGQG
jgi:hypothetical protein